jgi:RNA polymerase-binding transcription factor DksA
VQLAGERELAIRNLARESILLRQVLGALERFADGSYGTCLHCEEEIKPNRLDAVPWTKFCIRCQEAADRHEFETKAGDAIDEFWRTLPRGSAHHKRSCGVPLQAHLGTTGESVPGGN